MQAHCLVATLSLIFSLFLALTSEALASSTYRYRSPFRIEQCGSAIDLGRRLLSRDGAHPRGQGCFHGLPLLSVERGNYARNQNQREARCRERSTVPASFSG
jgi:hypothetical protein